jgi:hypothetical protein
MEPGERNGSPLILHRGFGFHLRPAARTSTGALDLQAVINHAPGLPVWSTTVEYNDLADDRGKSLADKDPQSGFVAELFPSQGPASARNFAAIVSHRSKAPVSDGAVKLKRARGVATIGLALDLKPLLVIAAPAKDEEVSGEGNGYAVTVKATRVKDTVTLVLSKLTQPDANDEEDPESADIPPWTFAIRDKDGRLHTGRMKEMFWSDADESKVEITLPAGKEIASFELVTPEKLTEIAIPFDFADLPIPPVPAKD